MTSLFKDLEVMSHASEDFGFKWPNALEIIKQIQSELREIQEVLDVPDQRDHLQEEIGDLIHAVFELCTVCGFDNEQTTRLAHEKYTQRFERLKQHTSAAGLTDLKGLPLETLLSFWKLAKEK